MKFRKWSIITLHTQHFLFSFPQCLYIAVTSVKHVYQLDPQYSALPHRHLPQDLQGSSFNWKQVKSLFLCWNFSHHWITLTIAGFAGKQKPVCQNTGRKCSLSKQNPDSPGTNGDDQGWTFEMGFFVCVIFKCAVKFPQQIIHTGCFLCPYIHHSWAPLLRIP